MNEANPAKIILVKVFEIKLDLANFSVFLQSLPNLYLSFIAASHRKLTVVIMNRY